MEFSACQCLQSAAVRFKETSVQILVNLAILIHLQTRCQPQMTTVSQVRARLFENVTEKVSWKEVEL